MSVDREDSFLTESESSSNCIDTGMGTNGVSLYCMCSNRGYEKLWSHKHRHTFFSLFEYG